MVTLSEASLERAMIDSMRQRRQAQLLSDMRRQEELLCEIARVSQSINRHQAEIDHLDALLPRGGL